MECDATATRHLRMELDDVTLTECKVGGDGARVQVEEWADVSAAMQVDHGQ